MADSNILVAIAGGAVGSAITAAVTIVGARSQRRHERQMQEDARTFDQRFALYLELIQATTSDASILTLRRDTETMAAVEPDLTEAREAIQARWGALVDLLASRAVADAYEAWAPIVGLLGVNVALALHHSAENGGDRRQTLDEVRKLADVYLERSRRLRNAIRSDIRT